jgi:hypothetical protein
VEAVEVVVQELQLVIKEQEELVVEELVDQEM